MGEGPNIEPVSTKRLEKLAPFDKQIEIGLDQVLSFISYTQKVSIELVDPEINAHSVLSP